MENYASKDVEKSAHLIVGAFALLGIIWYSYNSKIDYYGGSYGRRRI